MKKKFQIEMRSITLLLTCAFARNFKIAAAPYENKKKLLRFKEEMQKEKMQQLKYFFEANTKKRGS